MIVALLNQKGGVGKTTLALHLAGELAGRGQRVTLIDADGTAYVATSQGIFNSVRQLMSTVGHPATWARPIEVYAVEEKGRNNFRYLTLKYGKPSGK